MISLREKAVRCFSSRVRYRIKKEDSLMKKVLSMLLILALVLSALPLALLRAWNP